MIVKPLIQGKRDLVMTVHGKLGLWLKLITPELVDKLVKAAIENGK
jgi:hypothetical protein